jgi:hypothetical protein
VFWHQERDEVKLIEFFSDVHFHESKESVVGNGGGDVDPPCGVGC